MVAVSNTAGSVDTWLIVSATAGDSQEAVTTTKDNQTRINGALGRLLILESKAVVYGSRVIWVVTG
jgi:hypothetical protein